MSTFYFYKQLNAMDCGPACITMVAKYYGKHYNANTLRELSGFNKTGVSLLGISETAEKIGFRTRGIKVRFQQLEEAPLPAILHWQQNHFVVLFKITKKQIIIADLAKGIIRYSFSEFIKHWASSKNEENIEEGIALLLEPTPTFYTLI